jgi:hypothetical protein
LYFFCTLFTFSSSISCLSFITKSISLTLWSLASASFLSLASASY